MGARFATTLALLGGVVLFGGPAAPSHAESPEQELRVCADPNNLPFSNRKGRDSRTRSPN